MQASTVRIFALGATVALLLPCFSYAQSTDEVRAWHATSFVSGTSVSAIDIKEGVGFAAQSSALLYKTLDSGKTWTESYAEVDGGGAVVVSDVGVVNATVAVGINDAAVFRTTDGGETWSSVDGTFSGLQGIAMFEDGAGVLLAKNGYTDVTAYHTVDFGVTWSLAATFSMYMNWPIRQDSDRVWTFGRCDVGPVYGEKNCWLVSDDRGATWTEHDFIGGADDGAVDAITDIAFDGAEGRMTGYDVMGPTNEEGYYKNFRWKTHDGGATWGMTGPSVSDTAMSGLAANGDGTFSALGETILNPYGTASSERIFFNDVDTWRSDEPARVFASEAELGTIYHTSMDSFDGVPFAYGVVGSSAGIFRYDTEAAPLVKLRCATNADVNDSCRAVYYVTADGQRHAFPNEKTYFTWFTDFADVDEVSDEYMASLSLGTNATYHPGTKMVKFQTSPVVYAVSAGGVLRAIADEAAAAALYGADWNTHIDDVSDAFYGNYTFGAPILDEGDFDVVGTTSSAMTLAENFMTP